MTLTHLPVLLLVGALAGLMVDILHVVLAPELSLGGIPIISAILGAVIVVLLFSLVAGGGAFGYQGGAARGNRTSAVRTRAAQGSGPLNPA